MKKQEIKKSDIQKCTIILEELNKLMESIREYVPDANIYVTGENTYLLSGPSHSGSEAKDQQNNIVECYSTPHITAGDW